MRLDSISRLERFIVDALLSSRLIPLGVNVIRLADTQDIEGIYQMVNSIVVRYTGSSISVTNRVPLSTERTLSFDLNIASQAYLTEGGHDFAIQLLAGIYDTLINLVPCDTGLQILEPLSMTSERFDGLTDSTHYTYTQSWQIVVQEKFNTLAIDPCVAAGNCSKLFPRNVVQTIKPWETVSFDSEKGFIVWEPVCPDNPLNGESGVRIGENGDIVYNCDPETVFLSAEQLSSATLVPSGSFDPNGFQYIYVRLPDGTTVWEYPARDSGRRLLNISTSIGKIGDNHGGDIFYTNLPRNGYGLTTGTPTEIFSDPTNPNSGKVTVAYNTFFTFEENVFLQIGETQFTRVGGTPLGKAWVKSSDFRVIPLSDLLVQ